MRKQKNADHAKKLLSRAFSELHRALGFLKSFGIINHLVWPNIRFVLELKAFLQACVKILKKHDKNVKWNLTVRLMPIIAKLQMNTRVHLEEMTNTSEVSINFVSLP